MKLYLLLFLFVFYNLVGAQSIPSYQGKVPIIDNVQDYISATKKDQNQSLLNLKEIIPKLKLDIRYAGRNNFMHAKMYSSATAYLVRPAAMALKKISDALNKKGIGLIIYDAYRPYSVTVKFYKLVHDSDFVASPRFGSKHNKGCAVDLGLYDLASGKTLEMPTDFDSFSKEAASNYSNLPEIEIKNRELLSEIMQEYGFHPLKTEWWHFDYNNPTPFPPLDISFENLKKIH